MPPTTSRMPARLYQDGSSPRKTMASKAAKMAELPLMGAARETPIFDMPVKNRTKKRPGLQAPPAIIQR